MIIGDAIDYGAGQPPRSSVNCVSNHGATSLGLCTGTLLVILLYVVDVIALIFYGAF